jgi:hypothetical protein
LEEPVCFWLGIRQLPGTFLKLSVLAGFIFAKIDRAMALRVQEGGCGMI